MENMILVTRNIDDFKNITDLKLLNPWDEWFCNKIDAKYCCYIEIVVRKRCVLTSRSAYELWSLY